MGDAGFDVAAVRAAFPALNQKQVFMDVSIVSRQSNKVEEAIILEQA